MRGAKLFKFVTGDIVIATVDDIKMEVEFCDDYIKLYHPIEVITQFFPSDEGIKERYNLKPWQSLSSQETIKVDSSTVMLISDIKDDYARGYWEMVEFFFGDDEDKKLQQIEKELEKLEQDLLTEAEDEIIH